MRDPVLFPLDEEYTPHPDRVEPLVWIREMAILSEPSTDAILRVVSFRRGLNIVRTEERREDEEQVVAHSVGKTLLLRLIRYSIGEINFAADESQSDLVKALPAATIVAHWRVKAEDWIVCRPLHDREAAASHRVHAGGWKAALDGDMQHVTFKSFVKTVEATVLEGLPSFENTKGRRPSWLDILGWLARDCECGYRQANEWRHAGTNLGKLADLTDNSLMLQWLCGLMSQQEVELRQEHRRLLTERGKAKLNSEKQSRTLEFMEENLRRSMDRPKLETIAREETEAPFSDEAEPESPLAEQAQAMIDQLREIHKEIENASRISALQEKAVRLQAELDQANQDAGVASGNLMAVKKHLGDLKASGNYPSFLKKCPATACAYIESLERLAQKGRDDSKDDHLQSMTEESSEYERKEKAAHEQRDKIAEDLEITTLGTVPK